MNTARHACNYALLRFLPYPETGEFVNVGVLVICRQPRLLDYRFEQNMPERAKVLFPRQNTRIFADTLDSLRRETERFKIQARDPKSTVDAFQELTRARESVFRFGEIRTILTAFPETLAGELFARNVRMETPAALGVSIGAKSSSLKSNLKPRIPQMGTDFKEISH